MSKKNENKKKNMKWKEKKKEKKEKKNECVCELASHHPQEKSAVNHHNNIYIHSHPSN
eukprot:evm.model.NODE_21221_length_5489_cov_22.791948.2